MKSEENLFYTTGAKIPEMYQNVPMESPMTGAWAGTKILSSAEGINGGDCISLQAGGEISYNKMCSPITRI